MADANQVAADIGRLGTVGATRIPAAVRTAGIVMLRDVKRRASRSRTLPSVSGLPPRLQTGNYNRSIGIQLETHGKSFAASVGTNAVQARRLELGYDDGRSRTYPHPHFAPALEVGGQALQTELARIVQEIGTQ